MRHYHLKKNTKFCPTVNLDKLWTLVSEQTRENYSKKPDGPAPIIDVVRAVSIWIGQLHTDLSHSVDLCYEVTELSIYLYEKRSWSSWIGTWKCGVLLYFFFIQQSCWLMLTLTMLHVVVGIDNGVSSRIEILMLQSTWITWLWPGWRFPKQSTMVVTYAIFYTLRSW